MLSPCCLLAFFSLKTTSSYAVLIPKYCSNRLLMRYHIARHVKKPTGFICDLLVLQKRAFAWAFLLCLADNEVK